MQGGAGREMAWGPLVLSSPGQAMHSWAAGPGGSASAARGIKGGEAWAALYSGDQNTSLSLATGACSLQTDRAITWGVQDKAPQQTGGG